MRRSRCALALSILVFGALGLVAPSAVAEERQQRVNILIGSDAEFTSANGVRSGTGTPDDPYVISGWKVSSLHIHDTNKHFVIRDNEITNRLVLNWTGPGVTVVNNTISNLRVNENVKRTGLPTTGRIAHNKIAVVGQLRHWDGVFERNVVGQSGQMDIPFLSQRAVNFDGFNGARFRNNTIYGYMDVKLHGHHHGSGYGDTSHDHSAMQDHSTHGDHAMADEDHTQRYHEVWVTGNKIFASSWYTLGYNDEGHAGNDRTAASEQNEELNRPHVHYTKVHLNNNVLVGSGLDVSVFNAQDDLHRAYATGLVEIKGNSISISREQDDLFEGRTGISVFSARWAEVVISGNEITGLYDGESLLYDTNDYDTGISITQMSDGEVQVIDNVVRKMGTALAAQQFTRATLWLEGLDTSEVREDVYTDESARPRRR